MHPGDKTCHALDWRFNAVVTCCNLQELMQMFFLAILVCCVLFYLNSNSQHRIVSGFWRSTSSLCGYFCFIIKVQCYKRPFPFHHFPVYKSNTEKRCPFLILLIYLLISRKNKNHYQSHYQKSLLQTAYSWHFFMIRAFTREELSQAVVPGGGVALATVAAAMLAFSGVDPATARCDHTSTHDLYLS